MDATDGALNRNSSTGQLTITKCHSRTISNSTQQQELQQQQQQQQQLNILTNRDHCFQRNVELWAEPRNLPISTEFLHFRRMLRNLALACDKGDK